MKAQDFLKLVETTLNAQQDYFAAKRKGLPKDEQIGLLVKSKELEKQCRTVIAAGRLEPDEPQPTVHVYTTQEFQEQLRLINEEDINKQIGEGQ